jgi:UPF0176 protein
MEPAMGADGVQSDLLVAAFYAFTPLAEADQQELLSALPPLAQTEAVLGSVLIAAEGVNGTVCGPSLGVERLLALLRSELQLGDAHYECLEVKRSWNPDQVFRRFKARSKREIVTLGQPQVDPRDSVGTYVDPQDWNALIDDPNTLVIDARNTYEVAIGSFAGALNPQTESFRDFPHWVDQELRPRVEREGPQRIAMFCTGGIRCEKASSFLQQQGFGEVHHLRGGILRYLEEVPEQNSRWQGECFVFDQRVALNHQLERGDYCLCHACGLPVSSEQQTLPSYIKGVQCLHCIDQFTEADRRRFAMRQQQIDQLQA